MPAQPHAPACTCCTTQLIPTINARIAQKQGSLSRRDPSRMGGLRKQFLAETNRRFRNLANEIWTLIVEEDALGLENKPNVLKLNEERQRWRFQTSSGKVESFQNWLDIQIRAKILGAERGTDAWSTKYVHSAYKQGLVRSWIDSNREKLALDERLPFYAGTQAEFLRTSFAAPETVEKLKLIYTRSYGNLKGVTSTMSAQMSRVLADGLANGLGPRKIARNLVDAIDIPLARARTIARTEIMHAHAEGQLDALEDLGVDKIGVMVEWSTAGDGRVCPICQPLEGTVMTIKEARGLLPRHPNCRCVFIPANVSEKEEGQKRTKSRIASAIKRSLAAEGGSEKSRWAGADRRFSGKASQPPLRG